VRASAIEALSLSESRPFFRACGKRSSSPSGDTAPDVPIAAIAAAEKLRSLPESRDVVDAAYRHPKTLVQRLARALAPALLPADPAAYPDPEYKIARAPGDYAAILAEAESPWKAQVETARGRSRSSSGRRGADDRLELSRARPEGILRRRRDPPRGSRLRRAGRGPDGNGNGGPGYEIRDENNPLPYRTGTVGMALAGPDTGGSQWFVTHAPQPHLDATYTVFGQVSAARTSSSGSSSGTRIVRVTVSRGAVERLPSISVRARPRGAARRPRGDRNRSLAGASRRERPPGAAAPRHRRRHLLSRAFLSGEDALKPVVVATRPLPEPSLSTLVPDFEVRVLGYAPNELELAVEAADADALVTLVSDPVTER
jgi:cyclophilin family peptidyl-prolyl cis-trans isomerase